jgi:ABC-type transporter Mla subunit MlaD
VLVPAVVAPPRGTGAVRVADEVGSHRPPEVPATDPYAQLTSSLARAASALEDAAGVLETVTRTCASVLERIEDNRRDAFVAADAVAKLLSCPDARAETASSRPPATAMEPR